MNTARLAIAGALVAFFTLVSAGAAQAYPDPSITVDAKTPLIGGTPLPFTAQSGGVNCTTWTVTFNGDTSTGSGTSVSGTFNTPVVAATTSSPLTASCVYADGVANSGVSITLLPTGSTADNGALPDTGGSNAWVLVGGAALIVLGGGAVIASRRRG